jgi:ATP-dependent exoDNAse (exonuclease V) beta subunit
VTGSVPAYRRWLENQGHAADAATGGADDVVAALSRTLGSATGRWLLAAHPGAAAEQAWTSTDGSTASHHVIDRSFIADGCRWIVDYKTARLPEAELRARAESYRPQLERYAGLFADDPLPLRAAIYFPLQAELVELTLG